MFKRSILVGVSVAYFVSLVCGLVVAHLIARQNYNRYVAPTFEAMDRLELDQARETFLKGGKEALQRYLLGLDRAFGGRHYLLNQDGIDLIAGHPVTSRLPKFPDIRHRDYDDGTFHLFHRSNDGQYWFAAIGTSHETGPATWGYFAVCCFVTTGLLLFALFYLVFPLRRIRDALSVFGEGQMTLRLASSRKDEIGQVAATFDAMAERVEQSFRTERSLLQDISHELRAPLARLTLAVHLAKQQRSDELTDQIDRNVKKLSNLVGEITEFHQRWSAVENANPPQSIALEQVVKTSIEDCALEASTRDIELHLSAVPVTLHNARPELIVRVLENLLRNAIIHSPTGGRIEIAMQSDTREAVVSVRDFGSGVAPENLERIFDPFHREQNTQNERSGLGLGLSIARRGMQWHGGTLRAENASPGLCLIATFRLNSA